jgi:hypothetical protein
LAEDENAVEGVMVEAWDINKAGNTISFLGNSVTNVSGIATIENLPTDKDINLLFVKSSPPKGALFTTQDLSSAGKSQDSNADRAMGLSSRTFNFVSGSMTEELMDMGIWLPNFVTVQSFNDTNEDNRRQNTGEPFASVSRLRYFLVLTIILSWL